MAQAVGGKALGGEAREAGERARLTPFAVRAQRRGAASTAFCRKEKPFRNREITGAGLDLSPASRADRALATDTHGLRHGLYSSARFAGCALRRYTLGRRTPFLFALSDLGSGQSLTAYVI